MSKIICFEKWDCDCGTLNQMSFEFDNSITINQISKLADRILNDYYDESETNDEIELDEVLSCKVLFFTTYFILL